MVKIYVLVGKNCIDLLKIMYQLIKLCQSKVYVNVKRIN